MVKPAQGRQLGGDGIRRPLKASQWHNPAEAGPKMVELCWNAMADWQQREWGTQRWAASMSALSWS